MSTSFDVWSHHLLRIEIYGTEGSLSVPDPYTFGGVVQIRRSDHEEWHGIPPAHGIHIAAETAIRCEIKTPGVRPEPLPSDF